MSTNEEDLNTTTPAEPAPPPPVVTVDGHTTGDGQDGGGHNVSHGGHGDGGGGGGGGFTSGGDPLAGYRSVLLQMRIPPGPFINLMHQAAQQNWTSAEFAWALEGDPKFTKMFPGIGALLDQGLSVPSAVSQWRQLYSEWTDNVHDSGLAKYARLTPNRFGMYLNQGVDLQEMLFRVSIIKMAKTSDDFRAAFNAILKARGENQLDKVGWANFLAGKGDQRVYDLYEGTVLLQELGAQGLKVKEARQLAKVVSGQEGGPAFSASKFAEAITTIRRSLGDQLINESGLGAKGLALASLKDVVTSPEAAREATAAFDKLEQLMKNQQAATQTTGQEATTTVNGRPVSALAPTGG